MFNVDTSAKSRVRGHLRLYLVYMLEDNETAPAEETPAAVVEVWLTFQIICWQERNMVDLSNNLSASCSDTEFICVFSLKHLLKMCRMYLQTCKYKSSVSILLVLTSFMDSSW